MRKSSNPLVLISILSIILLLAGVILAFTYTATEEQIEANEFKEKEEAIYRVMPLAESYKEIEAEDMEVYEGYDSSNQLVGLAFTIEEKGFGGIIKMMVGLDTAKNELTGISILSHSETPGLGARIDTDVFKNQFEGKSINDPFEIKNDVTPITGATISSRAANSAIQKGLAMIRTLYPDLGGAN